MLDGRYFARIHQFKKARLCFRDAAAYAATGGMPPYKQVAATMALADLEYQQQNYEEAKRLYSKAISEVEPVLANTKLAAIDRSLYTEDIGRAFTGQGLCSLALEEKGEALTALEQSVVMFKSLGAEKYSYEKNFAIAALIDALIANKMWTASLKYCEEALAKQDSDGYTPTLIAALQRKHLRILQATGHERELQSEKSLPQWRASMTRASSLLREEKQFDEAAAEFRRAIDLAQSLKPNELQLSLSYMGLADCLNWKKEHDAAFQYLEKALDLRVKAGAAEDDTTDKLLKRLINRCIDSDLAKAEQFVQMQMKVRANLYGIKSEAYGESLVTLSRVWRLKRLPEKSHQAALQAFDLLYGSKKVARASAYRDQELACYLRVANELDKAQAMFIQARNLAGNSEGVRTLRAKLGFLAGSVASLRGLGDEAAKLNAEGFAELNRAGTPEAQLRCAQAIAQYAEDYLASDKNARELPGLLAIINRLCAIQPESAEENARKTEALNMVRKLSERHHP